MSFVLTLSCPDQPGIVSTVAQALHHGGMNITESHQFGDPHSGQFFMRVGFQGAEPLHSSSQFRDQSLAQSSQPLLDEFSRIADRYQMHWRLYDMALKPRVLILVSKFDHCLVDLLYRNEIGSLNMDIVGVGSNHAHALSRVEAAGLPFFLWPSADMSKEEVEAEISKTVAAYDVELIILARYMQILSGPFVAQYPAQIINIHHSFLPSFKGAVPYSRAFERGVKMIGATAHFVTGDLDEGPIISQGVASIRHDMHVGDLIDVGRDVERRTLAHAIRMFTQRRILLNGMKTVVFE